MQRPLFSAGSARQRHNTSHTFMSKQFAIVARPARSILARDGRRTSAVLRSKSCHERETQNTNTPARFAPRRTLLLNSWQAWARAARARSRTVKLG